jgi:hypothetical protein
MRAPVLGQRRLIQGRYGGGGANINSLLTKKFLYFEALVLLKVLLLHQIRHSIDGTALLHSFSTRLIPLTHWYLLHTIDNYSPS